MKSDPAPVHRIELHLRELAQLFNSLDPTPFHHKDLDPDAELFIESWALEFPAASRFEIHLHLEQQPAEGNAAELVGEAIHNYFDYKAELTRREFSQLMLQGRTSLVIGLAFMALCLLAADVIGKFAVGTSKTILQESLTIGGWVAMWRPLEIFLYDWWPLKRRQRIYLKLSRAQVRVVPGRPAAHHGP